MFAYIFAIFLVSLVVLDRIFMPRSARRSWLAMAVTFSIIGFLALYQDAASYVAHLVGVHRGVDLFIYIVIVILVREFFLSRNRQMQLERQLTLLSRNVALANAQDIGHMTAPS